MTSTNQTRSARFLERVRAAYDYDAMSPAELEAVDEVVFALDALEEIREEMKDAPLVQVRQGGARMSPLITEERLRSLALTNLLRRWFPAIEEGDE